jgi:hypothetical protein
MKKVSSRFKQKQPRGRLRALFVCVDEYVLPLNSTTKTRNNKNRASTRLKVVSPIVDITSDSWYFIKNMIAAEHLQNLERFTELSLRFGHRHNRVVGKRKYLEISYHSLSKTIEHQRLCRKAKFNCPLPGSPSGRPLIEAPNRAVLANSWNGYEGDLIILFGVAIVAPPSAQPVSGVPARR